MPKRKQSCSNLYFSILTYMITIHHNFDETQFKWLWAKYVKAGNISKHCTASLIGQYSKKFSGSSNNNLLSQPVLNMDEVAEDHYEAIYFCGVLKKGYLHKDPTKNNYRHNVHFAVRPKEGAHDVWDFEEWHVEIDDGILEHIPEVYELKEKFFQEPYTSHYYTCRIFRWMVGHFYPHELRDKKFGFPEIIQSDDNRSSIKSEELILDLIRIGELYAEKCLNDPTCFGLFDTEQSKNTKFKYGLVNRNDLSNRITESMSSGSYHLSLEQYSIYAHEGGILKESMNCFVEIGIEEYLDKFFPYQERRNISLKF